MTTSILDRPAPPVDRRVRYGEDALQFADLRLPDRTGPYPCVVAIHGGFWRNRYGLDYFGHLCNALTEVGIATWNIEYRRIGDQGGGWPSTFHDVTVAARFVFDHASDLVIDPERVVVLGHSAGGHLASWLASMSRVPEGSPIHAEPMRFRGAVSLAGVLDLERCHELGLSNDAVGEFIGGPPESMPERYAAASPTRLVPSPVPHLLVHGTMDENVPIELSERYHLAATAAGERAAVLQIPRADHFDVVDPESSGWATICNAIKRLTKE